jgi:aryl-alcohol dehydrogenase-like predicted oxidoreductase
VGASRPEQLLENVKASELAIDETAWDQISAILDS